MKSDEFNELRKDLIKTCIGLTESKGKDYTKLNENVLYNFLEGSEFFGMRSEQLLAVYLKKHIDAIYSYIKTGGQSESEPIKMRIVDAINYLVFLHALIEENKVKSDGGK